ncbi:MAG: hypothetical protein KDC67_13375, partial [Ignavibacteriae bacterium]|nr:hypothetical protein [Ignavibacteriota bacterium]
ANRVNSSFLKKNIWCPFANQWEFNFDIKPTKVRLDYLSIPIEPNWAYTIVNGVPKYDPDNSVDLQWNATMLEDVVNRMDEIYSRNVSDQFGVEFSRSKIKYGE